MALLFQGILDGRQYRSCPVTARVGDMSDTAAILLTAIAYAKEGLISGRWQRIRLSEIDDNDDRG
jgi:hypothetical protein